MTLFFFGAGASHGAGHIIPKSPPLGDNMLFNELCSRYPQTWGNLPQNMQRSLRGKFEDGMEHIWKDLPNDLQPLMQDMAKFFSQFHPDGKGLDLYTCLIDELISRGLLRSSAFSTLNYECCLDLALSARGRRLNHKTYPPSSQGTTLWKLHGSCNFILSGISKKGNARIIVRGNASISGKIDFVQPSQVTTYCARSPVYPCMTLYALGKPNQMGRKQIEQMQANWKSFLSHVYKVYIVGVNPYLPDTHIWEPLAKTQAHIYYIGGKEGFDNWVAHANRSKGSYTFLSDTFEAGFKPLIGTL